MSRERPGSNVLARELEVTATADATLLAGLRSEGVPATRGVGGGPPGCGQRREGA